MRQTLRLRKHTHGAAIGALLGDRLAAVFDEASGQACGDSLGGRDNVDMELLLNGADKLCII